MQAGFSWRFGSEQLFSVGTMQTEHDALRRDEFHESLIDLGIWNLDWDMNLEWDARSLSLQGGGDVADIRRDEFHESLIDLGIWNLDWDVKLEWDARSLSLQGGC
jgi:hypothetical protein